jgi:hypothetical protein
VRNALDLARLAGTEVFVMPPFLPEGEIDARNRVERG